MNNNNNDINNDDEGRRSKEKREEIKINKNKIIENMTEREERSIPQTNN